MWQAIAGSAAASLIGGVLNNQANAKEGQRTRDFNAQEAQWNRDFQERMSNTSYQRSMADMSAAGLNPMLAFSEGGASTPGGATASAQATRMEDAITPAINSAMEARRLKKEIEAVDSQAKLNISTAASQAAQADAARATARNAALDAKVKEIAMPAIIQESANRKKGAEIDSKLIEVDALGRRLNQWTGTVNNAMDVVNPMRRFLPKGNKTYNPKSTGTFDKGTGLIHD